MPNKKKNVSKDAENIFTDFEEKYAGAFKKAFSFLKKHAGTHTDEQWRDAIEDIKLFNKGLESGLCVAITFEIERIFSTGLAEYVYTQNNSGEQGAFIDDVYRRDFTKTYNHAKLMYGAHVTGEAVPEFNLTQKLYVEMVGAFKKELEAQKKEDAA